MLWLGGWARAAPAANSQLQQAGAASPNSSHPPSLSPQGLCCVGPSHLVAHADAKHWLLAQDLLRVLHSVGHRRWVALQRRSVGRGRRRLGAPTTHSRRAGQQVRTDCHAARQVAALGRAAVAASATHGAVGEEHSVGVHVQHLLSRVVGGHHGDLPRQQGRQGRWGVRRGLAACRLGAGCRSQPRCSGTACCCCATTARCLGQTTPRPAAPCSQTR